MKASMKSLFSTINRLLPFIPAEGSATKEQVRFFERTSVKSIVLMIHRVLPCIPGEGSATKQQVRFFERLLQENRDIEMIAETGFNIGVSSRAFLAARPDTRVLSFDIGEHGSVRPSKAAIDRQFPGRHELVLGDSRETLPEYARKHPSKRFDLVFIDGGHDYEVAKADLLNFQAMSHDHTIVIMDDLTPWWRWGRGPTTVWQEALQAAVITQEGLYKNGLPVSEPTGRGLDRIWAVGHYRNAKESGTVNRSGRGDVRAEEIPPKLPSWRDDP